MSNDSSEKRQKTPWWLWPNLLSLDAPLIALSWMLLFKHSYRIYALPKATYWLLFASVWVIYTVDRLLDSSSLFAHNHLELRHTFHAKFRYLLWPLIFVLVPYCCWIALQTLSATLILCTLFMVLLVILYFAHRILMPNQVVPILPKELFCGLIFALGTALAPRVYSGRIDYPFEEAILKFLDFIQVREASPEIINSSASLVLGMLQFLAQGFVYDPLWVALLFTCNCLAIACWEKRCENPDKDDLSALPSALPSLCSKLNYVLVFLIASSIIISFLWGHADTIPIYLSVGLSSVALLTVHLFRQKFSRVALRVLADVCLLTPWLVIPFLD